MRPLLSVALAFALLACALPGAARADTPRWVGMPERREPTERDRERATRNSLEKARSLRRSGSHAAAEAVIVQGLALNPDAPALYRERARIFDEQGRADEAAAARSRADALEPPPGPLPREALALRTAGLRIALLPPDPDARPERRPRSWPEGELAREIEAHLALRLPGARISHVDVDSVAQGRAWLDASPGDRVLSLRVDRVYCGDTLKDGRFGLAQLRVATAQAGGAEADVAWARSVTDEPRLEIGCPRESAARGLERALALPAVAELAAARPAGGRGWSADSVRALFPQIDARIEAAIAQGLARLAAGRLADAQRAFASAADRDPEDPIVQSYVRDAADTLALSRELARRRGADGETVDPRFGPAQRAAVEAQLAAERERRDRLLAALSVLNERAQLPSAAALAALVPVENRPDAFGSQLARRRAGAAVRARAARAPDGSELARYYFPEGDPLPVLREEDTDADGQPDRWIGYAGERRAEIWEAARHPGRPEVRFVLGADGLTLSRAEIDRNADGRPERVLHYVGGALRVQAIDADADGRFDVIDRFEADGRIRVREEDVDRDGEIDVRSRYEAGKLVRRELMRATLPES